MSPPPITPAVLSSMMAQESSEGYVILLLITHSSIPVPIAVASHNTVFTSNGLDYLPLPFQIPLPGDDPETTNTVELAIDNIDGTIAAGVRGIPPGSVPPNVAMSVVTIARPDTIEVGPITMSIVSVTLTRLVVTATLSYDPIFDRPYPADRLTPLTVPGMF